MRLPYLLEPRRFIFPCSLQVWEKVTPVNREQLEAYTAVMQEMRLQGCDEVFDFGRGLRDAFVPADGEFPQAVA